MNLIKYLRSYNLINNFPKDYPTHKKITANLMFLFARIIIHKRKNLLNKTDLKKAKKSLNKGDIIIVGNFKRASSLIIRGAVTHSMLYVGGNRFIHSRAEGVQYISYHNLFTEYDTMAILRINKKTDDKKKKIKKIIECAKNQVGKPYNFTFRKNKKKEDNTFICTQLINYCHKNAGYDTGLDTFSKIEFNPGIKIIKKHINLTNVLHPKQFIEKGNFDVVFLSHNLKFENEKLSYTGQIKKFKQIRKISKRIKKDYKSVIKMSNLSRKNQ